MNYRLLLPLGKLAGASQPLPKAPSTWDFFIHPFTSNETIRREYETRLNTPAAPEDTRGRAYNVANYRKNLLSAL